MVERDESGSTPGTGGDTPRSAGSTDSTDGVVVVSPDDDIQRALDAVASPSEGTHLESPYGVVRLVANRTYTIENTLTMPLGTVLQCNGARLVVERGDFDVVEMGRMTRLKDPVIDARSASEFDSALLCITDAVNGSVRANNPARVENATLRGPPGEGTGVVVEDRNGSGMGYVHVDGRILLCDVALRLDAEGPGAWVNSNRFDLVAVNQRVGVETAWSGPEAAVDGNRIDLDFQPRIGEAPTEWVWDLQAGNRNLVSGTVWDAEHVADDTVWRIGANAGVGNRLVDETGMLDRRAAVVDERGPGTDDTDGNVLLDYADASPDR